jgi:twinfilin-like protein
MQSGISGILYLARRYSFVMLMLPEASQELHTAFNTLVSSENQRGLLCTITKESLTPLTVLSPATSSFSEDLSLLAPHLQPNVALYIILRRYPSSESAPFVAVTYVPDSAPVRQKMLFASTRLTLVRELGIERFRETIFATTKEELTPQGFVKHDKHVTLEAPLTEEEQTLGDVKRKEAEEGRGMNERRSHVSSGVSMPITDEALQALKSLTGEGGSDLVQLVRFRYDILNLQVILISAENQHRDRDDGVSFQHLDTYFFPLFHHFLYRAPVFLLPLYTYL